MCQISVTWVKLDLFTAQFSHKVLLFNSKRKKNWEEFGWSLQMYLQGQPLGFDTKYLALADRNSMLDLVWRCFENPE